MTARSRTPERPQSEPRWVIDLRNHGWRLAVAESMTAGLLSARLAAKPGSGEVFAGGVVTYHTALKQRVLDIDDGMPVISAECALAMAVGTTRLCAVEVGLAITGVAGPATQEGRPVGLVFGAIATPHGCTSREWRFLGDAYEVRTAAVDAAVELLVDALTVGSARRATTEHV